VSPAQEHVQGSQWWTDYQPVSYILTSKRGSRTDYLNMINACHAAGVKVIAGQFETGPSMPTSLTLRLDTIWNHMTGEDSGTGVAGSSSSHFLVRSPNVLISPRLGFTHYNYPDIYQGNNFHNCSYTQSGNIEDYSNAQEVWTCQLVGLAEYAFTFRVLQLPVC